MEKLYSTLKWNKYLIFYLFDVLKPFKTDSTSLRELVLMCLKRIYTNNTICINCASLVSHTRGNFSINLKSRFYNDF